MNDTYFIPANYTDAGKLLGMFEIRNAVEALIFTVPLTAFLFRVLPFTLTNRLIVCLIFAVPVCGFSLMGVNDESLTQFLRNYFKWRKKRGIITYKGEKILKWE